MCAASYQEIKRETKSEESVVTSFTGNHENTMNSVVSNSVGMALLKLKKRYFNGLTDDQIETECLKMLSTLSAFTETKETKDDSLRPAIENIVRLAKEPSGSLDTVTLYLPKPVSETKEGKSEEKTVDFFADRHVFPLKQVLVLVWTALNDKKQFPASADTEKDQRHRLESLWNCLHKLKSFPVCHHGTRNELVFLLNKTYKDIDLIEDATSTILYFLKDEINKLFWDAYGKAASSDKKRELTLALFQWMSASDPSAILGKLEPAVNYKEQLRLSLEKLFIQHGTNPRSIHLDTQFAEMLGSLNFSCDAERYPVIGKISEILNASNEIKSEIERNSAIAKIKSWINTSCDFENEAHQNIINDFYLIYRAYTTLTQNKFLLSVTGELDKFTILLDSCIAYFKAPTETAFPSLTTETRSAIAELTKTISKCKKEELVDEVGNFFARWYATAEEKPTSDRIHLYKLLCNDVTQSIITLDDKVLDKFIPPVSSSESKEVKEIHRDITPYQVNRIFLHAIITKPGNWSPKFAETIEQVLSFVKGLGGPTGAGVAGALKRDSYPPQLIAQLDYLINTYHDRTENPRPANMILLPEQVSTAMEWVAVSKFLTEEEEIRTFESYGIWMKPTVLSSINSVGHLGVFLRFIPHTFIGIFVAKLGDRVHTIIPTAYALKFVLSYMPAASINTFLGIDHVRTKIRNEGELIDVLSSLYEEQSNAVLTALGIDRILRLVKITNSRELAYFLRRLTVQSKRAFLTTLGADYLCRIVYDASQLVNILTLMQGFLFYESEINTFEINTFLTFLGADHVRGIVRNVDQLTLVLRSLRDEASHNILNILNVDHLQKIIPDGQQLGTVLSALPPPSWRALLKALGTDEGKAIRNGDELVSVLRALPEASRTDFLTILGTDHVNKILQNSDRLGPEANAFLADMGIDVERTILLETFKRIGDYVGLKEMQHGEIKRETKEEVKEDHLIRQIREKLPTDLSRVTTENLYIPLTQTLETIQKNETQLQARHPVLAIYAKRGFQKLNRFYKNIGLFKPEGPKIPSGAATRPTGAATR